MTWQTYRSGPSYFPVVKLENYSIPSNEVFRHFTALIMNHIYFY